jgi:hypothetical protein
MDELRAVLVHLCKPYLSIDPEITFTAISDDAVLFEINAALAPPTAAPADGVVVRSPRVEMLVVAETLIELLEEIPGFQHWRHPDIEITGRVQHREDGTTELVSEGRLRVYLLVQAGDGDREGRKP